MDGADLDLPRDGDDACSVLLGWGAEIGDRAGFASEAKGYGNVRLAQLVSSELGGRRCEILPSEDSDGDGRLAGRTCVAGRYLPDVKSHEVRLEYTGEAAFVASRHLRRRDRTPADPGDVWHAADGRGRVRWIRFGSEDEAASYLRSVRGGGGAGDAGAAEERAERAARELLAELEGGGDGVGRAGGEKPGGAGGKKKAKRKGGRR